MKDLVNQLTKKNLTIATIESISAGLMASSIAEVPGASNVLKGGLVTYQTQAKIDVLGIDASFFKENKVVSSACASAMVEKGKLLFQTDIVVSCTGNAGPAVMDGMPVGRVYCGVMIKDDIVVFECNFEGSRNEIRKQVCKFIEAKVLTILNQQK